jgi:hypothetical protein
MLDDNNPTNWNAVLIHYRYHMSNQFNGTEMKVSPLNEREDVVKEVNKMNMKTF